MRRRQSIANRQPMASINVTSLLDIVFVLLIAFMVVAPAMKHGIELDLPRVVEAPTLQSEKPISIVVKPEFGMTAIYVNGQVKLLDEIVPAVHSLTPDGARPVVTLEGDRTADWETIVQVIGALRNAGIDRIGIQTTLATT